MSCTRTSTEDRPTWVIAHRGASGARPENTFAAFDEALRRGCDGIELDVQLSRDEVPVVYHDRTLFKLVGRRQRVAALDLDELQRLDAGSWYDVRFHAQRIPSLDEVLERYAGRTRLLIEIKTREGSAGRGRHARLARAVASRIARRRLAEVLVLSFDIDLLEVCAETAPSVGRVLNIKAPSRLSESLRGRLPSLFALSVDVRTLTPSFSASVHRAGTPLLAYTCNTKRRLDQALEAGVLGIMSDRPGWLRATLGKRCARDAS